MVDEIMFLELPVEDREQVMRDNCDQIIERSYTKKFDQDEINARRAEYANVGIQVAELEKQLAEMRADYKGRIKPLLERMSGILDEIKSGGEWVTTDVFLFKDMELNIWIVAWLQSMLQMGTSWKNALLPLAKNSLQSCRQSEISVLVRMINNPLKHFSKWKIRKKK